MREFSLEGKTALVAGASRGIGLAIARHMAAAGARVILAARSERELELRAAEIGGRAVRLETEGIRSEVAGLVAATLEPGLFSEQVSREGMRSLGFLLEAPVEFRAAPELFCLDFYKDFDIEPLIGLAAPTKVSLREVIDKAPARP